MFDAFFRRKSLDPSRKLRQLIVVIPSPLKPQGTTFIGASGHLPSRPYRTRDRCSRLLAQGITSFEALLIIRFAFGATVALVILLFGRISGAYINPAITLAHTIAGKITLEMFLPYASFQVLGGLLGAFTVKLIFSQLGSPADLGTTKLAGGVSVLVGILLETGGTLVLAMSGFLASLKIHKKPGEATLIGSTLFVIILALGPLTNASLNPARSLGPALATGYFTNLYVYWTGPLAGGLIAGLVYRFFERPKVG